MPKAKTATPGGKNFSIKQSDHSVTYILEDIKHESVLDECQGLASALANTLHNMEEVGGVVSVCEKDIIVSGQAAALYKSSFNSRDILNGGESMLVSCVGRKYGETKAGEEKNKVAVVFGCSGERADKDKDVYFTSQNAAILPTVEVCKFWYLLKVAASEFKWSKSPKVILSGVLPFESLEECQKANIGISSFSETQKEELPSLEDWAQLLSLEGNTYPQKTVFSLDGKTFVLLAQNIRSARSDFSKLMAKASEKLKQEKKVIINSSNSNNDDTENDTNSNSKDVDKSDEGKEKSKKSKKSKKLEKKIKNDNDSIDDSNSNSSTNLDIGEKETSKKKKKLKKKDKNAIDTNDKDSDEEAEEEENKKNKKEFTDLELPSEKNKKTASVVKVDRVPQPLRPVEKKDLIAFRGRNCVFVGQISFNTTAEAIKEHFTLSGLEGVASVRLLTDKQTKKSKGMAFVDFESDADVNLALKLHHSLLDGRRINVELSAKGGGKNLKRQNLNQKMRELKNHEVLSGIETLLQEKITSGTITESDIDDHLKTYLKTVPLETATAALEDLATIDMSKVRNKKAYIMGVIKRHHHNTDTLKRDEIVNKNYIGRQLKKNTVKSDKKEKKNGICHDFNKGLCDRGDKCKFSHVGSGKRSGENVCFDFSKGACSRGDSCKYSHSGEQTEEGYTPKRARNDGGDDESSTKKPFKKGGSAWGKERRGGNDDDEGSGYTARPAKTGRRKINASYGY